MLLMQFDHALIAVHDLVPAACETHSRDEARGTSSDDGDLHDHHPLASPQWEWTCWASSDFGWRSARRHDLRLMP